MMHKVSIITPCYNCAPYIGAAIESVIAQTYQNWEMWIVDDGSEDESATIIKQYVVKDSRIHYLEIQQKSGVVVARNLGIQYATGRYIAYLDGDDLWLPFKLEVQLKVFSLQKKVALVYSDYQKIDDAGRQMAGTLKFASKVTYQKLLTNNIIATSSVLYDTQKVGKIFHSGVRDDFFQWLSILRSGYIGMNAGCVTFFYRVRSSSLSRDKLKATRRTYKMYRHNVKLGFIFTIICLTIQSFSALRRKLI